MGAIAKSNTTSLQKAAPEDGINTLLKKYWPRIEAVMPKHMSSERLFQLAVTSINSTPKLAECSPASLLSCVMKCSALGLEPSAVDGLGRAYILPYRNGKTKRMEATFILGYKGMIDLARNSGQIKSISARAVYKGDEFTYSYGLNDVLEHAPKDTCEKTPENITHVYAIAKFSDGGYHFEVMTKAQVDVIRKRSKASELGPWVTDYEAMAVKTVIRRASKMWPMSTQAKQAVESDGTDGGFTSMLEHDDVIDVQVERVDADVEAEVTDVDDTKTYSAVCKSCGYVIEPVDPNKPIKFECCEAPDYQLIER